MFDRITRRNLMAGIAAAAAMALVPLGGVVLGAEGDEARARAMLALVNRARSENGLDPVTIESRLMAVAQAIAQDLAARRDLSHTDSKGRGIAERFAAADYHYATAAEDVAAGRPTAEGTFADWMGSPGHRANILLSAVREIGVGYVSRADDDPPNGIGYRTYWALDLGVELTRSP